jgi:hypothetical protein
MVSPFPEMIDYIQAPVPPMLAENLAWINTVLKVRD